VTGAEAGLLFSVPLPPTSHLANPHAPISSYRVPCPGNSSRSIPPSLAPYTPLPSLPRPAGVLTRVGMPFHQRNEKKGWRRKRENEGRPRPVPLPLLCYAMLCYPLPPEASDHGSHPTLGLGGTMRPSRIPPRDCESPTSPPSPPLGDFIPRRTALRDTTVHTHYISLSTAWKRLHESRANQ